MPQLFARLHARWDFHLDFVAVDAREADRTPERGSRERHRYVSDQVGPFTQEYWVALHMHEQVKIAGRSLANARFAFARDPDSSPFVDAGRYLDRKPALVDRAAFAMADRAGIADGLAASPASWAATLNREEALLGADLSGAAAGPAGVGTAIGTSAALAFATLALRQAFDGDGLFGAGEGFLECQLNVVAQVCPTSGVLASAARVHELAEDRREDIRETLEAGITEGVVATATVKGGLAELIVSRALLRILEDVIGLVDRLEVVFGLFAAVLAVRVMLLRKTTIGGLD